MQKGVAGLQAPPKLSCQNDAIHDTRVRRQQVFIYIYRPKMISAMSVYNGVTADAAV